MTPAERYKDLTTDARLAAPRDFILPGPLTAGVTIDAECVIKIGSQARYLPPHQALGLADWIIACFRTEIAESAP